MTIETNGSTGLVANRSQRQRLHYNSAVDRRLVHRQSLAEVFITDSRQLDGTHSDTFSVGAQLPRTHSYYRTATGNYDTVLLAEVLRQSAIYLAHTYYGVPLGYRFTMQHLRIESLPWLLPVASRPVDLDIRVLVSDVGERAGVIDGFTISLTFKHGHRQVASGSGFARVFSPGRYRKLRWKGAPPREAAALTSADPLDPASVGKSLTEDVVLAPTADESRWTLRIDPCHPILFEHPSDHIPGMLIVEAFRQAGHLWCKQPISDVTELDVHFDRFGELDIPTEVTITSEPDASQVRASVTQRGDRLAHARLSLADRWSAHPSRDSNE